MEKSCRSSLTVMCPDSVSKSGRFFVRGPPPACFDFSLRMLDKLSSVRPRNSAIGSKKLAIERNAAFVNFFHKNDFFAARQIGERES